MPGRDFKRKLLFQILKFALLIAFLQNYDFKYTDHFPIEAQNLLSFFKVSSTFFFIATDCFSLLIILFTEHIMKMF